MIRLHAKAFVASMKAARQRLARMVYKAVKQAAKLAADHAKATPLFKDRSTNLRSSIKPTSVSADRSRVTAGQKYASWVENGNAPPGGGRIYPKHAKFLRWTVDNTTFFAKSVKPAKPRPFMAEAQKHATPLFEQMCIDAVNGMFR